MTDPHSPIAELAGHMLGGVPHSMALGLLLVAAEEGFGSMRVPWRADLVGDAETQVIAGGVVTALMDHCAGLAVSTSAGSEPFSTATLDLRIDYMRPAAPGAGVTCEARCYRLTRTIGFVRAEAFDVDAADPIATAQAAFIVRRPEVQS